MNRINATGGGWFSSTAATGRDATAATEYVPTQPYNPENEYNDHDLVIVRVDPTSTERSTIGSMMNSVRRKLSFQRLKKGWYFGVIDSKLQDQGSESNIGTPSIFITKAFNHDYRVYVPEVNSRGDTVYYTIDVSKRNLRPYNRNDLGQQSLYYRAADSHPDFFKSGKYVKAGTGFAGGGKTRRARRRRGRSSRRR